MNHARKLELAMYQYCFHQGSYEDVIQELSHYQTKEGGFGKGLEPDCWNPEASPIQTWRALTYLDQLLIPDSHPLIQRLLTYLTKLTYESDWIPSKLPTNNLFPHAIWWHYHENDHQGGVNPSVSLWAYLYRHTFDTVASEPSSPFLMNQLRKCMIYVVLLICIIIYILIKKIFTILTCSRRNYLKHFILS